MDQNTVVYIILSAILLYLYYQKRDISIFAAFIVVVGSTLIFSDRSVNNVEGFGGGGKVDSACAKMGFTAPKLVKNVDGDIGGSLEKEIKKIKKVADKHWPYDEKGNSKDKTETTSIQEFFGVYMKEATKVKDNDDSKKGEDFVAVCKSLYDQVYNKDESKRQKIVIKVNEIPKGYLAAIIPGGNHLLKILEKVGKSSEIEDDGAKKLVKYLTCLCKHWILIIKKVDSMASGSSGSGEKKKKKKKTDDDDDDDDE